MDGSDQGRPPPEPAPSPRSASMERTPELWFDDATNIIQAGNYQFRVHRGILAASSPVLSSFFSDPTPEGTVEGCSVIHLSDEGEDVKNLLLATYDPAFFEPPPKDVPVKLVLSIARLSHKYEIQHLRRRAILHMERNYPPNMDAFISRYVGAGISGNSWFHCLETQLNIILTANTINALWVLPAVYYHCSDTTLSHTFRASPSWNNLQRVPALRDLLTGKINLEIMDGTYADFLATPPSSGCLNRERCALHKLSVARRLPLWLRSPGTSVGGKCHTLMVWRDSKWVKEHHCKELCAPCASACVSAYESSRGDYWDNIPSAFNLPSWKELKLLQEADVGD